MGGRDGTGPRGQGVMTGRGMGYCMLRFNNGDDVFREGYAGIKGEPVEFENNETFALARGDGQSFSKEGRKMPNGDRTGPEGMGSMTGRAMGYCGGNMNPWVIQSGVGRGPGYGRRVGGRGMGRGLAAWQWAGRGRRMEGANVSVPSRDQELELLRVEAEGLNNALQDVQKRIAELAEADA